MKNITVSVPDDVYRAARIRAAEQGRSVSGLVTTYLRSLADEEADTNILLYAITKRQLG